MVGVGEKGERAEDVLRPSSLGDWMHSDSSTGRENIKKKLVEE